MAFNILGLGALSITIPMAYIDKTEVSIYALGATLMVYTVSTYILYYNIKRKLVVCEIVSLAVNIILCLCVMANITYGYIGWSVGCIIVILLHCFLYNCINIYILSHERQSLPQTVEDDAFQLEEIITV